MSQKYLVKTEGDAQSRVCIVEMRAVETIRESTFTSADVAGLVSATTSEVGLSDFYYMSIQFLGASKVSSTEALRAIRKEVGDHHDLIITFGADAMKAFCRTNKTINEYAGSLTWHAALKTWVLPTHHPGRVVNGEYHVFDFIYDHFKRAAGLLEGRIHFPPPGGHTVQRVWYGGNGKRSEDPSDPRWSGYEEASNVQIRNAERTVRGWLDELDEHEMLFALDTETTSADFWDPVIMIQIYDGKKAYAFNKGVFQAIRDFFIRLFRHRRARFVLHNTAYDRGVLRRSLGVELDDRDIDTMCLGLALTEKGNQVGLKYLSRQYANAPFYEEALDVWLNKSNVDYAHIKPEVLAEYGCMDVFYTYQLAEILPPLVEREGPRAMWLVENILLPAQRMFDELTYEGIPVDEEQIEMLDGLWEPRIEAAVKEVQEYAARVGFPHNKKLTDGQAYKAPCDCVPVRLTYHLTGLRVLSWGKFLRESHDFNPECAVCNKKRYVRKRDDTLNVRSPAQMQHLCFDILGMRETYEGRKTNKLFWSYNEGHEFAELVMKYREIDYLRTHFVEGLRKHIMPDGRVHPNFMLFGTKTGRLAVRNPAMQTIPSRSKTPDAKAVKKIFTARPGYVVINADYKNLEMFMNHHLTKDPVLIEDLTTKDIYVANAADMFAKAYELITDEERQNAKTLVLSAGYGVGANKLSNTTLREATGGDKAVAQDYLNAFWGRYKEWANTVESWRDEVAETGELVTWFGRKRRWPLICEGNWFKIRNQAGNFPGQSMASDLCLTSLLKLHKELKERGWGRVWMSVHDSIVAEVKEEFVKEAAELIKSIMSTPPFETETPFRVDLEVGPSYGEVSKLEP